MDCDKTSFSHLCQDKFKYSFSVLFNPTHVKICFLDVSRSPGYASVYLKIGEKKYTGQALK